MGSIITRGRLKLKLRRRGGRRGSVAGCRVNRPVAVAWAVGLKCGDLGPLTSAIWNFVKLI